MRALMLIAALAAVFVGENCENEVVTHTPSSIALPKSMNMMAEDVDHVVFRPTPLPENVNNSKLEDHKARALNFTLEEPHSGNGITNATEHVKGGFDLSDVTIGDDDEEMDDMDMMKTSKEEKKNVTMGFGICEKGGLTYENGEKLENGCDNICTCRVGKMECEDRCKKPFFRKGKKIEDPLCIAKDTEDSCCSILVCSGDTETEPLEMCSYDNKIYNRGESFNKGCEEVCLCEAGGKLSCKSRCPPRNKTTDRCVEIPDPKDSCCKKVLCDVNLDENESEIVEEDKLKKKTLVSANYVNDSTIFVQFDSSPEDNVVEFSEDKKDWKKYKILPGGYVSVGKDKIRYARSENSTSNEAINVKEKSKDGCEYNGKTYKINEEFNDNCKSFCKCHSDGIMKCLPLQCPTYFGLDVLDPNCIEWETIPPNFEPTAPNCCPESVRCKNDGSCRYKKFTFKNWEQLPAEVTGCEKKCYCEMGNVECQQVCPPVVARPPLDLGCDPTKAFLGNIPGDDCCKFWTCPEEEFKGNKTETSTESYSGILTTKTPSKILGPLALYENQNDGVKDVNNNNLGTVHKQKVDPLENPYYHKEGYEKTKAPKEKTTNSLGIPNKLPSKKPSTGVFQTPPPALQQPPTHTKPAIPEEVLQFINQHPEINNYPSGSVVEIHNVPKVPNPVKPQIHLVPYLSTDGGNDLPPGISLEQILQEFHKNAHPFLGNAPTFPLQHPSVLGPHNGIVIPNKVNNSYAGHMIPGAFPNFHRPEDSVTVHTLEAIDPHTVRLAFMVPAIIVGLHGRVEVRYTHTKRDDEIDSWSLQIFAPPEDLIATPSLEFDLLDLRSDTEYKIKITITLRDVDTTHSSRIYHIRTPKDPQSTSTLPPLIPIEPELSITDINSTWVVVNWRKFTDYELQFIDGIQLRYKETDGKIYAATPLIHRAVTSYTLANLKPNTKYELGIFFVPFPGQSTELHSKHMLHFTTANLVDTYGFNVTLEIGQVKSQSVEVTWSGVPYPEDKYVHIYRAIYQSDTGKEDISTFKMAKRDSATRTVIGELKPGTRYRIWLEVYLTNGRVKTSNVQDFITKPRPAPSLATSSQHDKLSRAQTLESKGDYYGPLVIVAILAAIAVLSTLVLLLILVKRHNQNKAAITSSATRVSQSAYDNPTYKVEIQQETMGL